MGFWTLAGHTLLANASVTTALVVPFSQWQGGLAARYILSGPLNLSVVPSCSGLDVMALCVAATLAYPVAWRRRLTGAAIGVVLLLVLNVFRLATLARASHSPWFETLHVSVWPAVLVLATAGWVVIWIRSSDHASGTKSAPAWRRYAFWTAGFLAAYVITVPLLTDWQVLDLVARDVAHLTVWLLNAIGVDASVTGRLLRARDVSYLITPECVTTPLVALYLGAVCAAPLGWRARALGLAACLPLFLSLAVVRLLTVALPPLMLGTDLILTHAFHQVVAGVVALAVFAIWARHRQSRLQAVGVALIVAAIVGTGSALLGFAYVKAMAGVLHVLHLPVPAGVIPSAGNGDVQGALLVLPIYQVSLFLGLTAIVWSRIAASRWAIVGLVLVASQVAFLAAQGWLESAGISPLPALWIRGWAVVVPVVLTWVLCQVSSARSTANPKVSPA